MEGTPKSRNTLGIEEAREPAAASRKETKNLMETGPGATQKTMGPMDTKTRNDEKTKDAVMPMEATVTQAVGPNDTRKAMKTAAMEATGATADGNNQADGNNPRREVGDTG